MAETITPSGADPTGTAYSGYTSANYGITSPYVMNALGRASALSNTPYQAFNVPGGEANAQSARVAGMNPMETAAYQGLGSFNAGNMMGAGMGMTMSGANASWANPATSGAYMSPYMQNVVEQNKQNAIQDWQRQQPQQQAAGFQAGAGRGSRSALLQAESQRNLQNQLQGIQAQGTQAAYEQGRSQFETEMQRRMQGGQNIFSQGTDIFGRQVGGGQAYQANKQKILDAMYEDFQKERNYPRENVDYLLSAIGRVPSYSDYSTKSYQTAAPINTQTATAGGIEALLNSLLGK